MLILLVLLSASGAARGDVLLDGMLSSGWEDNVPRGFLEVDRQGSAVLAGLATAGQVYQPLINTTVVVSASAGYHRFLGNSGFNRFSAGLALGETQKFGLGPYSPRLGLSLSGDRDLLRGQERDRDLYNLELTFAKRLSQSWEMTLGMGEETSRGLSENPVDFTRLPYIPGVTRPTDPMDYYNDVYFATLDYEFANGWLLSTAYRFTDGYIVASSVPPVQEQFLNAKAVALDPAFRQPRLLYLLKTDTDAWSTTLSVPTGADTAVDFDLAWQGIEAPKVGKYRNAQFSVNLIHRF